MNLDDLALGWREALLAVVVLLVLYVGIVFRRLRRLRGVPPMPAAPPAEVPAAPPPAGEPLAAAYAEAAFPWNEAPDTPGDDNRLAALDGEVLALRNELSSLRGELASLREELRREIDRMHEQVQASQHVAPIYGDAMQMALAGHDAASIAERCGIARAEAELVVALIRNRDADDDADGSIMKER